MRKGTGRKLLVASLGVAAVSYVACEKTVVANLMAPPTDASADVAADGGRDMPMEALVANLMAPPDGF
ncbi:MAG: hypothetical protein ABUS79_09225 [Pseudomonadota bacterium]